MALDPRILGRRDEIVETWRALCRIPSVSGDRESIARAADWIQTRLEPLADRIERYEIPGYGPVIAAFLPGASDRTLLMYNHYDVQPAGDPARWTSDPFGAEVRDGAVWARGACDDKADVAGRLASLELWIEECGGSLPFSVIYLADPCEEVGSPGLDVVLAEHRDVLRADACLWESYLREEDGSPALGFGCRGSLEVQLTLDLLAADQHPSYAAVLRSAPLEMMAAITSMHDDQGRITVPGFLDGAIRPDDAARARAARVSVPSASIALPGVDPHPSASPAVLSERFIFSPAISLSGFEVDEAVRQSIPARCTARVRFSLVPGMTPERSLEALRAHLASCAPDITVEVLRTMEPAFSAVDSPFARAVAGAAASAFEAEPVIYDVMTGAGPGALILKHLGAPVISPTGTLRPDGNMHGYDEHGSIDDHLHHVQFTLDVLRELERCGFAAAPTPEVEVVA